KKYGAYGMEHLAIVPADGSTPPKRVAASEALDRGVSQPRWGEDGQTIYAIVTDDMSAYGARIPVSGGSRAVPITDRPIVLGQRHSAASCAVVISGDDTHPNEVYSATIVDGKLKFKQLTHQNDALFSDLRLGTIEEVSAKSKDGTEVHALPTKPADYVPGTAFTVAFYGTDQYIIQYDYEIGPPWDAKAWETYQKISYPFLHADRIKTPTLFLGGEKDFNVPVQGGQQMYQALRSLGIDTQL